ncbi:uncharacterized protein EI97DRAFT_411741 [Westerdykella ornata]|uniref:Tachykinin family protein n=1 Tax=Westerdykella ornata TaxID=318751 RepID=A0A6A6JVN1_WESOR|nr:uncharacterized protein EI97DRAFT_411741 [Westerdykella ornata]KAF2280447.1 hypothetical protein EI97DRAFT_411741 [Westerdykella ornata]
MLSPISTGSQSAQSEGASTSSSVLSPPSPLSPSSPQKEAAPRKKRGRPRMDPQQTRAAQRRGKGSPEVQFLTATHPSEFKSAENKKTVRSGAMKHYRSQYKDHGKKKKTQDDTASSCTPVAGPNVEGWPSRTMPTAGHSDHQHPLPRAWAGWRKEILNPEASAAMVPHTPRSQHVVSSVSPSMAIVKEVDYEENDSHEQEMMQMLVHDLRIMTIGDGVDSFCVFPQFRSAELNSMNLVRECLRAFATPATIARWKPLMMVHEHILLSSTAIASTWIDMQTRISGDTRRTMLLKGEVISWINQRLRDPAQQFQDSTLMIILQLLVGEMWSCDEETLRIHEKGIARLINHRGGMTGLGGAGAMAEVAASCCQHTDIICGASPLPLFQEWESMMPTPVEDIAGIPWSPLFSPRLEFSSLRLGPRCSPETYDLLCAMRYITDLFIEHMEKDPIRELESDEVVDMTSPNRRQQEYDTKIDPIYQHLLDLPSASIPGLSTSNDWVYEACRIAAIIHATAIIRRVPFHVAAEGSERGRRMTDDLYAALELSNTQNVWGNLAGVLYWVSLVGVSAARTPKAVELCRLPGKQAAQPHDEAWVRRCFVMYATRTMLILIFQHPLPVVLSQRKMLRIQELVGRGYASSKL